MSLVNDMLRDLENRWPNASENLGQQENRPDPAKEDQSEQSFFYSGGTYGRRSHHKSGRKTGLLIVSGVAVFFLVIFISQWFKSGGELPSDSDRQLSRDSEQILLTATGLTPGSGSSTDNQIKEPQLEEHSVSERASLSADSVAVAERQVESSRSYITPEIQRQIDKLLKAGHAALLIDRLTTPDYDNAYDRFRAVLSLNPEDEKGLAGIQQVRDRYLQMLGKALNQQRHQSVPGIIRKALLVGIPQAVIDEQLATHARIILRESEQPSVAPVQVQPKASEPIAAFVTTNSLAAPVVSTPKAAQPVLSQSFKTRDEKMVEQAQALMASGFTGRAIQQLEVFVKENSQSIAAFQELFTYYLQAKRHQAARELLDKGTHLSSANQAYLAAQFLVAEKNYPDAIEKLMSHSPPLESSQSYHALKAALYHKVGDYKQSELGYRQLISIAPGNPAYWLGLSVALDDSSQVDALPAFQKVIRLSSGVEAYIPYVRERISVLSANKLREGSS